MRTAVHSIEAEISAPKTVLSNCCSAPGCNPQPMLSRIAVFSVVFSAAEFFDHTAVAGTIECRERLGGLLRYYYREAA